MPLTSGTSLGAYEIVGPLGAGGMGEVYQARDTQLGRDVALKILPDVFAHDCERLARFEREAKMLASLNHPNIAAIYGLETSTPIRALVMELVPGRTLDQVTHLTIDEAIAIARQIADALEGAHERGVIHRDLKPSNVKVRDDGTVKLLDFGLAKALTSDGPGARDQEPSPALMNSPTMTSPAMTQQGFILGTAAYMSPEQAKGKAVDRRADIWAFGVLLYEMLTGRRLFDGETTSEILAAVLRQDIDLGALPPDTPVDVTRLVARCLDRDPRTRLRDIGEARVALSGPLPPPPPSSSVVATSAPVRSPWRTRLGWLAAGLVIGATAWVVAGWSRAGTNGDTAPAFALKRLTDLPGPETQPDISPDGREVIYTGGVLGNRDIYLLRVGGARAINLTAGSKADNEQGRFSPTGDHIVFRSNRDGGGLFVMGATGESVKRLTTAGFDPAWSPDSRLIVYSTEGVIDPYSRSIFAELWTVEIATGKTSRLFAGDAVQPAWSPDGSRIAFWANHGGQRDIWTIGASGGDPVPVTTDLATDWSPEWSSDGRALYFVSDRGGSMNVWRIRIDQSTGRTSGDPQPLTNGVRRLGYVRLSKDGTRMVAAAYDVTHDLTIADFDPANPERIAARTTLRNQSFTYCDPSSDGAWLACTSIGSAHEDIVLIRSDGGETRRLMDDEFKDRGPTWSPDGKTLAFYSTRGGRWETWSIQADGSNLRQLTTLDKDTGDVIWAPDGKSAIVASVSTGTAWRIDMSRTNTIETAQPLKELAAARLFGVSTWSPDGALLAGDVFTTQLKSVFGVWDLARGTLRVFDLPQSESHSRRGMFLRDSRRLVVSDPRGLFLLDLADGKPRLLRAGEPTDFYSLSRDGRTLVIDRPVFDSDIWLMEQSSSRSAPPGR